ncbi:RecQ family ATP-dependent DNA helicase [Candidatus Poriferisodalis sp.]|uniref:RecQ family ATP-dependent DNA helicase n=1 Tax=Candidatus Poriferisodalis sp. TaxID=3101277 RepID=UPI003B018020
MSAPISSKRARRLLRKLTGDSEAGFRDDQLEVIQQLVDDLGRVLLVQRTGWGKSAVYFIATKMLREAGFGPTLLVSPLLALMRNQIDAAAKMGVHAVTINSSNQAEWDEVIRQIEDDEADIVLISPERLANQDFRSDVLPVIGNRCGLLVIDEAHCISDWGHDFRPDYRRLVRVLDLLPTGVPVLCCTATANDRVVADVTAQLGSEFEAVRGPLGREGLRLHALTILSPPERLTWLAATLKELPGTGIVYCSTVRDTERVASWLVSQGIDAVAYSGATDAQTRPGIEQSLLSNSVKAVVATSALGMGFDKPDLSFVIHYQSTGSAIAYYQQVGRAGRGLSESWGILLRGSEDANIQDYFITSAFPDPSQAQHVVALLESDHELMTTDQLLQETNVRPERLENLLKNLEVDGVIERIGREWRRTLQTWTFDHDRIDAVTSLRRSELRQLYEYIDTDQCRMRFLRRCLDDPVSESCGMCDNCTGVALDKAFEPAQVQEAVEFMRSASMVIEPRKQWPDRKSIPVAARLEQGRVLSRWGDGGWGSMVRRGKQSDGRFRNRLVKASVALIRERWRPDPEPKWVTFVPSRRHRQLVADFARRFAEAMELPCQDVVRQIRDSRPQKSMQNSHQQYRNVAGAFSVDGPVPAGPVLLVDDIVDSRWTLTAIGHLLREAGSGRVIPFALADASERSIS